MNIKKWILVGSLVLALAMTMTGTVAYLSDTDEDVNVMVLGNVDIEQHEMKRTDAAKAKVGPNNPLVKGDLIEFTNDVKLYPAYPVNGEATDYTAGGSGTNNPAEMLYWGPYVHTGTSANGLWDEAKIKGAVDKFIFVENTGKSDAYFRTVIAFECPEGIKIGEAGQGAHVMINSSGVARYNANETRFVDYIDIEGERYAMYEYIYQTPLKPGQWAHPSLLQVVMTHHATNKEMELLGETYEILVVTQAVQTTNFESVGAEKALDAAFGDITVENHPWVNGSDLVPVNVIEADTQEELDSAKPGDVVKLAAGTYKFPGKAKFNSESVILCEDGVVFEGTSALNINGATLVGATFSNDSGYAVSGTINGTLKDCTFESSEALRWCYTNEGDEVVFENCEIKTDFRGFHFDDMKGNVTFRNCTIAGFNACGGNGTLTFEGCTFVNDESSYNGLNLYCDTVLKDCTFIYKSGKTNFIDMEDSGKTLTITNCTATLDGATVPVTQFVGGSKLAECTYILDGVKQ